MLIKPNEGAEIIDSKISTNPPEMVKYSIIGSNELKNIRIDEINLRTKQSIFFDVYLESEEDPTLNVFWSNEEDVQISEGSVEGVHSVEESIIGIIRDYIFALISPGLVIGIFYFLSSTLILLTQHFGLIDFNTPNGGIIRTFSRLGLSNFGMSFGFMVALYFYLHLVPATK